MQDTLPLQDELIKSSEASLQKGAIRVDGRLTKTREYLNFVAHNPDSLYGPYHLALNEITKVNSCWGKGAGILPITADGIEITLEDGLHYQFIVAASKEWINLLCHDPHVTVTE